jgi:hypothetical protein
MNRGWCVGEGAILFRSTTRTGTCRRFIGSAIITATIIAARGIAKLRREPSAPTILGWFAIKSRFVHRVRSVEKNAISALAVS